MLTFLLDSDSFDAVRLCLSQWHQMAENMSFLRVLETQMFMMPSLITTTIAATWMYRSLADFCSNDVYGVLPFRFSLHTL
jgi:hypothetical protein